MNTFIRRIVQTTSFAMLWLAALARAAAAQTPSPAPGGTDVFDNMPGVVYLLIPLAIAGAIYLSRELGRTPDEDDATSDRRQGAVSRALAQRKDS